LIALIQALNSLPASDEIFYFFHPGGFQSIMHRTDAIQTRPEGPQRQEFYSGGPQIGYRRNGKKGFLFRAYLDTKTYFPVGFGFGWSFRKRN
jgi:hypothetical protein